MHKNVIYTPVNGTVTYLKLQKSQKLEYWAVLLTNLLYKLRFCTFVYLLVSVDCFIFTHTQSPLPVFTNLSLMWQRNNMKLRPKTQLA